jgi:hypothetical protein
MGAVTMIAPDGLGPGDRVWVRRAGSWRPGIVMYCSTKAATVRYRPTEARGTGVDTVTAVNLAARDDDDPFLDHAPEVRLVRAGAKPH